VLNEAGIKLGSSRTSKIPLSPTKDTLHYSCRGALLWKRRRSEREFRLKRREVRLRACFDKALHQTLIIFEVASSKSSARLMRKVSKATVSRIGRVRYVAFAWPVQEKEVGASLMIAKQHRGKSSA